MTRPTKLQAIERLKRAIEEIPRLKEPNSVSKEFRKWHRNTEVAIANTFEGNGRHVEDFKGVRFSPPIYTSSTPPAEFQRFFSAGLDSAASVLESMIEEIEEYWPDEDEEQSSAVSTKRGLINTSRVFLVHGKDYGTREEVARFIEQLGISAVILEDQADQGRTIIEKFEEEARVVGLAVVLLTPDDEGRLRNSDNGLMARARQNVIFELGYFAGALGRRRVCAMIKGDVEIPSDYDGIVYIRLDEYRGWKLNLVQELKAAGFHVDANRAISND